MFGRYKLLEPRFIGGSVADKEFDSVHDTQEFIAYFDKIRGFDNFSDLRLEANLDSFIDERQNYWNSLHGTPFDKLCKMHFKYCLVSMLERQNKVCMANSVENRVSFLDNDFVQYMFSLPEEVLMKSIEGE